MTDLYDMPGHLARRFQQIAVAVFHSEVAEAGFDLTPVQYAALVTIELHPRTDQASLAGLIAYDRATIGGVVDRLTQKGLVVREVSTKDRRAHALRVTTDGLDTLRRIRPAVLSAQDIVLRGLDAAESSQLIRLLQKAIVAGNELSRAPLRPAPAGSE